MRPETRVDISLETAELTAGEKHNNYSECKV